MHYISWFFYVIKLKYIQGKPLFNLKSCSDSYMLIGKINKYGGRRWDSIIKMIRTKVRLKLVPYRSTSIKSWSIKIKFESRIFWTHKLLGLSIFIIQSACFYSPLKEIINWAKIWLPLPSKPNLPIVICFDYTLVISYSLCHVAFRI